MTKEISSLSDAAKSFSRGIVVGGLNEGASAASRKVSCWLFDNLNKSQQKDILKNVVFKDGNYYQHWTWRTYEASTAFYNYNNRFSNRVTGVISTAAKMLGW